MLGRWPTLRVHRMAARARGYVLSPSEILMPKARRPKNSDSEVDNYGGGGATGTASGAKGVIAWDKRQGASGPEHHVKPSHQDESHAPRRKTLSKLKLPSYCLGDL